MRAAIIATIIVVVHSHAQAAPTSPTAEDLFNAGQAAYDRGDYALAIDRWQVAYQLSKEPALLYNIAQAQRLAGDCKRAVSSYKQFITGDPTSDRRPLAEDFVRELDAECGAVKLRVTPHPVVIASAGNRLKVAGLASGGIGVSLLASGLLLGKHASTLGDRVTSACSVSCDWNTEKDTDATGHRDAAIGYVLDGVGIAVILGGAVVYYVGGSAGRVTVTPISREGGAAVLWSGTW
jgi:hypothetical protein